MEQTPLERACKIAGGQAALGRKIGRSQSTIWNWLKRGIPAEECPTIESAVDGAVTRYDLRPDVFGSAPIEQAATKPAPTKRRPAGDRARAA